MVPKVRPDTLYEVLFMGFRERLQGRMFRMMYGRRSCKSLYPIPDEDGWDYEPMPDQILKGKALFRAGAYAVQFVWRMQNEILKKRIATREEEARDMKEMLMLYSEVTKTWLAKTVKVPMMSILNGSAS